MDKDWSCGTQKLLSNLGTGKPEEPRKSAIVWNPDLIISLTTHGGSEVIKNEAFTYIYRNAFLYGM